MKKFLGILIVALLAFGSVEASAQTKKKATVAKKTTTATKKTNLTVEQRIRMANSKFNPATVNKTFIGKFSNNYREIEMNLYNKTIGSQSGVSYNYDSGKYFRKEDSTPSHGAIIVYYGNPEAPNMMFYDIVRADVKNDKNADIWVVCGDYIDEDKDLSSQVEKVSITLSPDNRTLKLTSNAKNSDFKNQTLKRNK